MRIIIHQSVPEGCNDLGHLNRTPIISSNPIRIDTQWWNSQTPYIQECIQNEFPDYILYTVDEYIPVDGSVYIRFMKAYLEAHYIHNVIPVDSTVRIIKMTEKDNNELLKILLRLFLEFHRILIVNLEGD